jgi:hypothetical protein
MFWEPGKVLGTKKLQLPFSLESLIPLNKVRIFLLYRREARERASSCTKYNELEVY